MNTLNNTVRLPHSMSLKTIILILVAAVGVLAWQWHQAHGAVRRSHGGGQTDISSSTNPSTP